MSIVHFQSTTNFGAADIDYTMVAAVQAQFSGYEQGSYGSLNPVQLGGVTITRLRFTDPGETLDISVTPAPGQSQWFDEIEIFGIGWPNIVVSWSAGTVIMGVLWTASVPGQSAFTATETYNIQIRGVQT